MNKFIIGLILFLISTTSSAHSGRTDSSGCHNDRKNGGYHCHKSDSTPPRNVSSAEDYDVSYNQKSKIYHRPACNSALACTVNCSSVKKSEAIDRGGRPCGRCGG